MTKSQKDREITRLQALLKVRNTKIRVLKQQLKIKPKAKPQNLLDSPTTEFSHELQNGQDAEAQREGLMRVANEIFKNKVNCAACDKMKIDAIAFCTSCNRGWAYCNSCGGFERAQQENLNHITPTHGVFLDMFDKNEVRNSFSKPN